VSLDHPLFLMHPHRPHDLATFDATAMGFSAADVDALPWAGAFAAMAAIEQGAVANVDEGRQVGHYWLRAPQLAPDVGVARGIGDVVERVVTFAQDVRAGRVTAPDGSRFTDVLHVGIGGSALGPMLLVDALAEGDGLRLHFVDNTDPDGIARILRRVDLRTTLAVVVSKSEGTPETANGARIVARAMEAQGLEVGPRMVAITSEGSQLDREAVAGGWLTRFPMWDWVGGRTSVTAAVGLLPAAFAGIDVRLLLDGAAEMDEWTRTPDWRGNPAALLAAAWHVAGHGKGDKNLVILPYSDRLLLMSRYLQQLVMESLGKTLDRRGNVVHQGISVLGNKGSTDQHAFVQQLRDGRADFFCTFVQVLSDGGGDVAEVAPGANAGDFLQGFLLGTRRALRDAGRPTFTITLPRVTAREIGAMIALFERAVGLYGELVDLNAYHQPGVEAGKAAARQILELAARLRAALSASPATAPELASRLGADPIEVYHLLERWVGGGRASRSGQGKAARYSR
jgi:glucose-6-phosphate isomerase